MSFVNDIVIFGEAFMENVQIKLFTIEFFCVLSGQRTNFDKSQVIYPNSLSPELADMLFRQKEFTYNSQDISYLGFPFLKNVRATTALHKTLVQLKIKVQN